MNERIQEYKWLRNVLITFVACLSALPESALWASEPKPSSQLTVSENGNGKNNFKSIAEALAALPPGGGTVLVKRGTYEGGFNMPANTTLFGERAGVVTIIVPDDPTAAGVSVSGDGVTIRNVEIDGRRSLHTSPPDTHGQCGIYITGAQCLIDSVYLHDTVNLGISATTTAAGLKVLNSRIENTATNPAGTLGWHLAGIFCNGTPNPMIANNVIRGWSQAIGLWWGVSNALVEGNQLLDNYGFADADHTIPRSAVEDYGAEVGNFNNRFVSNTVVGSTAHCFEIATGVIGSIYQGNRTGLPGGISNYGDQFSVTGNISQRTRDIIIAGNTCVSNGERADSGVIINGDVDRTEIRDNTFTGFTNQYMSGTVFIGGMAGVGTVLVENNQFADGPYPIRVACVETGVVIRANTIRNATRVAIHISSGSGHVIEGNDIEGNPDARGVTLTAGNGHQVIGNRISVGTMGVLCMTKDNLIRDNAIVETTASYAGAIRIYGPDAIGNQCRKNVITAAPNSRALLIDYGADLNLFVENIINFGDLIVAPNAGANNVVQKY